ncbi:MAG: hypothetical protein Q7R65_01840, partial [bacterium]|nr:hypothetical protein [bacterium]
VGTIAKRRGMSQEALADLLGFNCDARENDLYYWFLQIGGYKTVRFQRWKIHCVFTETTIKWCNEILKRKKK